MFLSSTSGFLLYLGLVVFIALEGRQETTDRWVRQKVYCRAYGLVAYQVRGGMSLSPFCFTFSVLNMGRSKSVVTARWVNFWLHNFSFSFIFFCIHDQKCS